MHALKATSGCSRKLLPKKGLCDFFFFIFSLKGGKNGGSIFAVPLLFILNIADVGIEWN